MEYFRAQDSRYRIPTYNSYINSKMKDHQTPLAPLKTFSFLDHYHSMGKEQQALYPTSRIFQPPPFIIGGFVGSKICEQKAVQLNCTNLLGQIIKLVTSFEPVVSQPKILHEQWRKVDTTKTFAQVVTSQKVDSHPMVASGTHPTPRSPIQPSPMPVVPSVNAKMQIPVDSSSCAGGDVLPEPHTVVTVNGRPSASRTLSVSEGSDNSWASDEEESEDDSEDSGEDDGEDSHPAHCHESRNKSTNSWLNNIIVCPSDDESDEGDDDDSDWDCVDGDDLTSENGEIIFEFKWNNGDSLSPIPSPVTRTPPALTPALEDYDSDESEGILITCDPRFDFDDEEEARERQLAEKRIEDANRRWLDNLEQSTDVPDGKLTSSKKVQFPVEEKMIQVHSIVAWSFAYRAARKGEWERQARDRTRFRERIQTTATILAPILDPSHREKIRLRNETAPEFPVQLAPSP